jgi:hypothetical protein
MLALGSFAALNLPVIVAVRAAVGHLQGVMRPGLIRLRAETFDARTPMRSGGLVANRHDLRRTQRGRRFKSGHPDQVKYGVVQSSVLAIR